MISPEPQVGELTNAQVMRLLSGVSAQGEQHLAEVERDLAQMDVLLDEAIRKLCASFMAINHAVGAQREMLDRVLSAGAAAPDCAARFEALGDEISRHVGAAVTGLQFQDMTSQLTGRMKRHLAELRDVLGALDANGPAPPESRAGIVRSTVNQRHMESGDIELF